MNPFFDAENIALVKKLREGPYATQLSNEEFMHKAADAIENLTERLDKMWQEHRWCGKQ